MELLKPINQGSCSIKDRFLVAVHLDGDLWRKVETWPDIQRAEKARDILAKQDPSREYRVIDRGEQSDANR